MSGPSFWICRDCSTNGPANTYPLSTQNNGSDIFLCENCGSPRILPPNDWDHLNIAHIDCDAFYASVEKRDNPQWLDKPLIIGHDHQRGIVSTACYIARLYGIKSAMPIYMALEKCPHAIIHQPDINKYRRVSLAMREIIAEITDCAEPLSLDEAYLDLSPSHRQLDMLPVQALIWLCQRIEQEIGITISVGLSYNKFMAKFASEFDKPRGFSVIPPGQAQQFLSPRPVRDLWGVGPATVKKMNGLGLMTIGQVQKKNISFLSQHFGQLGHQLSLYAHGQDNRQVTRPGGPKSISVERTFAHDLESETELSQYLEKLCHKLSYRLVQKEITGLSLTVKLKTSQFQSFTKTGQLPHHSNQAEDLGKLALKLLSQFLEDHPDQKYRLLGVGVAKLQTSLTTEPTLFTQEID